MRYAHTVLPVLALPVLVLLLAGCGSYEFTHSKAVDSSNYRSLVLQARRPVCVLFHGGLSSSTCLDWGPLLDKFARHHGDKLDFYHCNVSDKANARVRKEIGANGGSYCGLFEDGEALGHIRMAMPDRASNSAQLFGLLKEYVVPDPDFGGFIEAPQLAPGDFGRLVQRAELPVVLCFKNCSG